jgi:polysaccharide export outer membrane protein
MLTWAGAVESETEDINMRIVLTNAIRCLVLSLAVSGLAFCNHFKHFKATDITVQETAVDSSYIIGPQDVLEIQIWKEPDFSRQILVRPDGKITLPLIGDVQASGMNTMDLRDLLAEKLKGFVDNPEVTVIVLESHSKNFYIMGKVNRPGTYPLIPEMTVLQALSVAGGLGEWADSDSIRIIRRTGGKEEIFAFDYDKVVSGKKLEQNIVLAPNDTIIVP